NDVDALTDRPYQMLARGICNVELALIECQQSRRAVAKILNIVCQAVLLLDCGQRRAQRSERTDLHAMPNCHVGTDGTAGKLEKAERRKRQERAHESGVQYPRCRH